MRSFLQRLFGFSLGPILGALISLIQVPVLTYFLSSGEYGKAGAFQTLLLQIPNFIYIGIDQAYTREYHQAKNKNDLMHQALVIPMSVGLILCLIFVGFDQPISQWLFGSEEYTYIVWYAGVWVLAAVLERFVLLSIRMEERAFEFSFYSLLLKIGVFAVSLLLIAFGWRDFRVIVYGLIFGQLVIDFFLFWRYRDNLVLSNFSIDANLQWRLLKFGLPIMVASSVSSALNSIDTIFLNQFNSFEDVGIYSLGIRIAGVVGIVKTAFASFWVPTAYRWYEEKKTLKHYKFISDAILFVLSLLFFGVLLLKKPLGWVLSRNDPNYMNVQYIVGLLIFPHIMYTLSETTTLGIVFSRKTYYNIFVSLLTFVPSVLLNMWLTPHLSYVGAALASTVSFIMFYLARTYFSKRIGFYFGQGLQIIIIIIMTMTGIINAFDVPYIECLTFFSMIISVVIQLPTLKTAWSIYRDGSDWDFT